MIKNTDIITIIENEYLLKVLSINCLQDGPDNLVLKIVSENKNFVFRISKRCKKLQDIEFEASLAYFLSETNLPIAKIIYTQNGASFCLCNGMVAVLFEFCEGETFAISPYNKPSNKLALNGGKTLAKLHKMLQVFHRNNKNFGSRKLTSEVLRVLENKHKFQSKYINSKNFLLQITEALQNIALTEMNTIIHNDFRIQNVLILKDNICTILDFDWACEGNNLKDLSHALVEWSYPDGAEKYWEDIFYSFLVGYENEYGSINRTELKKWISFSCLSDTCTYLMNRLNKLSEPSEIRSFMYKKYLFFKGQNIE